MCAVVGAIFTTPTETNWNLIKRVLVESKIRGLHATGISFLKGGIQTIIEPVAADAFVEKHMGKLEDFINEDGNLYMVAHCRYSTSDLEFNQPIAGDRFSIVHNGVITQEPVEQWTDLYGYECITKNDSELMLRTLEQGKSPLKEWTFASISACVLNTDKTLMGFRNGKRPLYQSFVQHGYIYTSTEDIAKRAGINNTWQLEMNTYRIEGIKEGHFTSRSAKVITGNKDLQNV